MKHNSLVHFDANRNKGRTNKRNSICLLYKCISYPYRYLFSTQMQNIATLQYRFNFLVKFELFRSGTVCTVCLDNPREVVLQGCGHVCVCGDCASRSGFPHYRNYLLYASAWWSFFFLVVDSLFMYAQAYVCQFWKFVKGTAPQRGVFAQPCHVVSYFRIRLEDNRCPVCRQEIDNIEPVYIS